MIPKDHLWYRLFCLFFLLVNIVVIAGGAFVRATGSGDGCGNHWPLCHGVWLPDPHLQTLIELGHRITSSLVGFLACILVVWSWRVSVPKAPVRSFSLVTALFVLLEGLVGAVLVKFALVGENVSVSRLFAMPFHLVFTFSLLAFGTLTLLSSVQQVSADGVKKALRPRNKILNILFVSVFFIVAGTGALTALSDTLFKPTGLNPIVQTQVLLGWHGDFHILERIRALHPAASVVFTTLFLYYVNSTPTHRGSPLYRTVRLLTLFLGLEILAGVVNIVLLVPIYMQMIHLMLACLVWIFMVLFFYFQKTHQDNLPER